MSRRVYSGGVLVEFWDDATLTYYKYDATGTIITQRTYTADETAKIVGAGAVVIGERQMVVLDDSGSEILRIGDMLHGDRGLRITREKGGAVAMEMRKAFANSSSQVVTIRDASGNLLVEEEALGPGLGKPNLSIPMLPVTAASTTPSVGPWGPQVTGITSATFVTTHQAWFARANNWAQFRIQVAASDTTTAAEVQVLDPASGLPLAAFFASPWLGTRAAGSTGYVELVAGGGSVLLPGASHERISVAVQVRRTAGTGSLTVAVPEAHGWNA